jgi:hypothetical protein
VPAEGLVIVEPPNQSIFTERSIVVRGLAQPGVTITREVPFWFDDHTIADTRGRWSFALTLNEGENQFHFRVGDDFSTQQTLTVYYRRP